LIKDADGVILHSRLVLHVKAELTVLPLETTGCISRPIDGKAEHLGIADKKSAN